MNCVYSNQYLREVYERTRAGVKKLNYESGSEPSINQGNLLLLSKLGSGSSIQFRPESSKTTLHDLEHNLNRKDDFIAYGAEFGYILIPVDGAEVLGEASEIITFGDPTKFGKNAPSFETIFNGKLRVITSNVTRMDNFPTRNFRNVPQFQEVATKEIPVKKLRDSMFQIEPLLMFEGNTSHSIEVSFEKTLDNLNSVAGYAVYAAINFHGFVIETVNKI